VIHGTSERIIAHNPQALSRRWAKSLLKSGSFDPLFVILPTESPAGFGPSPGPVEL
jgi:hypothetical protein